MTPDPLKIELFQILFFKLLIIDVFFKLDWLHFYLYQLVYLYPDRYLNPDSLYHYTSSIFFKPHQYISLEPIPKFYQNKV
jgi:hypothetical protein